GIARRRSRHRVGLRKLGGVVHGLFAAADRAQLDAKEVQLRGVEVEGCRIKSHFPIGQLSRRSLAAWSRSSTISRPGPFTSAESCSAPLDRLQTDRLSRNRTRDGFVPLLDADFMQLLHLFPTDFFHLLIRARS